MANWLWSIPSHDYEKGIRARTFAVRVAGLGAVKRIARGDTIFVYFPGVSVIAGIFRAAGPHFRSTDIIWDEGVIAMPN